MKTFILLQLLCGLMTAEAQRLRFSPVLSATAIITEKPYYCASINDSITFSRIAFYISNLQYVDDRGYTLADSLTVRLLDTEHPESFSFPLPTNLNIKEIQFTLGIDSLTQESGVRGGDLDPMHGMYWTWQSGYIHAKIEGKSPAFPSRKNEFQYHLGGYRSPWSTLQSIRVQTKNQQEIEIQISLDTFLRAITPAEEPTVMQPGSKAQLLSYHLAQCFQLKP